MIKFTKKDFYFSLITGITAGFLLWKVSDFLEIRKANDIFPFISLEVSYAWLMVVLPVLWIMGVGLGIFLGKFFTFFIQFGKFSAIGFTNFAVDLGVLNSLIALTSISVGLWFGVFKAASFLVAMIHSFFWNKYWAFGVTGRMNREEVVSFFSVATISWVINVGVASGVVNLINPIYGLNPNLWANVGAIAGSATSLIVSFIGFKIIVFKK